MKKVKGEEIRTEYVRKDLGKGIRGKYLKAFRSGSNLVLLKPEVASAFPTERAVNEALSSLINVAQHAVVLKKRPTKRAKSARG